MTALRPHHAGRHALDGTLWMLLAQGLMVPTGLATVAYLTRRLGPSGYGDYAVVLTIAVWVEFSLTSVFSRPTVKFIAEAPDWRGVATSILRFSAGLGIAAMLLLWALAHPIALVLGNAELAWYIRLAALDIPLFVVGQAYLQILAGQSRFRYRSHIVAVRWLARLGLIVLLVELGYGVTGAILGCIGASLVELVLCRIRCDAPILPRGTLPWRKLFGYAGPLLIAALALRVLDGVDLLALKSLGGTAEQAGQYAAAANFAILPGIVGMALTPVLLATMSQLLAQRDRVRAIRTARLAMRGCLFMLPLAALTAGCATEITVFFFGPQFSTSGPLLAILIFAGVARLYISIAISILTAAGRPSWCATITVPAVPLTLAALVVLIPAFGPLGAAWATTAVSLTVALGCGIAVFAVWGLTLAPLRLLRTTIISLLVFMLARWWPTDGWMLLPKLASLMLLIAFVSFVSGEYSGRELRRLRSIWERGSAAPLPTAGKPR